ELNEPGRGVAGHAVGKNKCRSISKDFIIDIRHAAAFFVRRSLCSYYEAGASVNLLDKIPRPRVRSIVSVSQQQLRVTKMCRAISHFCFLVIASTSRSRARSALLIFFVRRAFRGRL